MPGGLGPVSRGRGRGSGVSLHARRDLAAAESRRPPHPCLPPFLRSIGGGDGGGAQLPARHREVAAVASISALARRLAVRHPHAVAGGRARWLIQDASPTSSWRERSETSGRIILIRPRRTWPAACACVLRPNRSRGRTGSSSGAILGDSRWSRPRCSSCWALPLSPTR